MSARLTVVGSGFAGMTALRTLRRQDRDAELTLVAPAAELHYLPGTIWLPSGKRTREDLVVPLEAFLRRERIAFHAARATGLSPDARVLHTDAGDVRNDGLVIATGARFLRKLPGIEHAIIPCEGVAAGEAIRDRLATLEGGTLCFGFGSNPAEPIAMRGGPVFEFVFGTEDEVRRSKDQTNGAAGRGPRWCSAPRRGCGATAPATASTWCSSARPRDPGSASGIAPSGCCWAKCESAASKPCSARSRNDSKPMPCSSNAPASTAT